MAHNDRSVAVVEGVRTPFMRSHQAFVDLTPCDLGRFALSGLMAKLPLDPDQVEHVAMGTVIHDPTTSNVARESVLAAGFPVTVPAHTVSLACISSNVAATTVSDMIQNGHIDVAIFGGVDTCSDPPIRISRQLRKTLVRLEKVRGVAGLMKEMKTLKSFKLRDMLPEIPKVVEFSNGKSMGEGAEILAKQVGVTREEADAFALRSHQMAIKAQKDGVFDGEVVPVHVPPSFKAVAKDDGPRADTTAERLAKLRPAFDKKFGVATAGNSSFLTDGASAVLLASQSAVKEQGLEPKAWIRDYVFRAGDALNEMLSGPSLTIPALLQRNKLKVEDIDVWEIHEAFASQVVANLHNLKSTAFAKERLKMDGPVGEIPMEKINTQGGSLSLGHPFGATGGRLIWTAARRLHSGEGRWAVVAACAAGGHGSAILLEKAE